MCREGSTMMEDMDPYGESVQYLRHHVGGQLSTQHINKKLPRIMDETHASSDVREQHSMRASSTRQMPTRRRILFLSRWECPTLHRLLRGSLPLRLQATVTALKARPEGINASDLTSDHLFDSRQSRTKLLNPPSFTPLTSSQSQAIIGPNKAPPHHN